MTQIPRRADDPPDENDQRAWVRDAYGRWWMMCEDNTHPKGFICCLLSGHTGPHKAQFAHSSEVERW